MITDPIFDDTKTAFKLKTDSELERAYYLFKMISIQPLVKIGSVATNLALKARLPIEGLFRSTVFDHFCGGVTEKDCLPVIEKLYAHGVSSVLDYSVEGKETAMEFDSAMEKVLNILNFAKNRDEIPIAVFKPTALGRFKLYERIGKKENLNDNEKAEWQRIVNRYDTVCKKAKENDVAILIDAEESWMQDAADELAREMMQKYNTERAIVFNTLQMYRHDRFDYLKKQHELAKKNNYCLGYKIVRGAYLEKENDRADEKNYKSPICKDKFETDSNFDRAANYILDNLNEIELFAGTHNEDSCYLIMEHMKQNEIENNDKRVWFGQLYGMSDHISFNLAERGYNVAKYIPFGPVKDVMPYLIRRAEENTSVAGQTGRELSLLSKEKKRRKIS